jgi:hypothetical protein
MRSILLAVSSVLMASAALADTAPMAGPQEVGSTTMPPGQYYVTEQMSHKSYSLTVTDKGNMILGPAPDGVEVRLPGAATTAAVTAATTVTETGAKSTSILPTASGVSGDAIKGLMKEGMQKGMSQLLKQGTENELKNFIK